MQCLCTTPLVRALLSTSSTTQRPALSSPPLRSSRCWRRLCTLPRSTSRPLCTSGMLQRTPSVHLRLQKRRCAFSDSLPALACTCMQLFAQLSLLCCPCCGHSQVSVVSPVKPGLLLLQLVHAQDAAVLLPKTAMQSPAHMYDLKPSPLCDWAVSTEIK